jgi:hypothetical protein
VSRQIRVTWIRDLEVPPGTDVNAAIQAAFGPEDQLLPGVSLAMDHGVEGDVLESE